ncbi:putative glycosyltransferase [Pseudomonas fluorescens]|uniref:Putative glycosyltransferase n=1 Tax=Pseudomonas fluorescens TaxID=294 RepID=A0A5E7R5V2_PSEFL|nr:glycosyltransferase family 2 protein [Pseudomonas fluorescens]VVP69414.1 putative glycosyltransferase [Pseudomonas fluorescens]
MQKQNSGSPPCYDLTVIIPCFDEEDVLPMFHKRITDVVRGLNMRIGLLYVNDGSTDSTADLLDEFAREVDVRCLHLSRNFGKEAAMWAGMEHAEARAIVFIDADLQDPPELIPSMIVHWVAGYDVVNMQRRMRHSDSWLKRTTATAYYRIMSVLVKDFSFPSQVSDFRLLGSAPLAALNELTERSRVLKGLAGWIGFKSICLEYDREGREAGKTKWNMPNLLGLAIDSSLSFSHSPLRWFSYCAALVMLVSIIAFVVALIVGELGYENFILVVLAFMTCGIALLGEYVGILKVEAKGRPHYFLRKPTSRAPENGSLERPA